MPPKGEYISAVLVGGRGPVMGEVTAVSGQTVTLSYRESHPNESAEGDHGNGMVHQYVNWQHVVYWDSRPAYKLLLEGRKNF